MTDSEILQMREQGYTYQQIADKCGVSRQRIHQRIKHPPKNKKPYSYFSQDITFCSNRKCENKNCKRNHCHIDWSVKPYHSFSDFENTKFCPKVRNCAESGLLCPKCNSATKVYDSRPKKNGTTKRYRECLYCGFRFKTVEIAEAKLKECEGK